MKGAPVIPAAEAYTLGSGLAAFSATVRDLAEVHSWSDVTRWLTFALGLWRRTHLLLTVDVPGLWPWLRAHFASSPAPEPSPSQKKAPAAERPTPPRNVTADIPPRDASGTYRCYTCDLVGWTSRCCPLCHPSRPGAAAWIAAFDAGSQSKSVVSARRLPASPSPPAAPPPAPAAAAPATTAKSAKSAKKS